MFSFIEHSCKRKRREHGNSKEVAAQTSLDDPDLETLYYHQTGGIQMGSAGPQDAV